MVRSAMEFPPGTELFWAMKASLAALKLVKFSAKAEVVPTLIMVLPEVVQVLLSYPPNTWMLSGNTGDSM